MLLRTGFVAILAGIVAASSAPAQNGSAPDNFRFEIEENFITLTPGHWESSGAFTDEGVIQDVSKHDLHGASVSTVMTLAGNDGTFTWKFTRVNTPTPGPSPTQNPAYLTGGAWQMVSGTGAYSGITGQGTFDGTINFVTGEIHDTFTGHVSLGQTNDAFQFRTVE